jgi:hypothetical protein
VRIFPFLPLFMGVRGRVILRTSHCPRSANFALTEFSEVPQSAKLVL